MSIVVDCNLFTFALYEYLVDKLVDCKCIRGIVVVASLISVSVISAPE